MTATDTAHPARLRAGPALGARPRAQRAGLLRRPRRAEPLLGHRRHLPVGVPDDLGRRRRCSTRRRRSATTSSARSTRSPPPTASATRSTHLIYSHHHADHAGASSLFDKNVTRIGHEETRRLLLRDDDPARPPNEETFQDRRTLEIGGERIDLAWHGANHSPDNIIIHLPDHDTLMLIDIVNPGWAPVYLSNLTEDIPGYIEAPANALAYSWKHFIGGHIGRLGTRDDVDAAPAVHGRHRRELQEGDRHASTRRRYFVKYGENVWAALKGYLDEIAAYGRRAGDREVHRRARGRRRLHREHDVPGDAVDPPRPRLRLAGAPLMTSLPVRDPVGDHLLTPQNRGARRHLNRQPKVEPSCQLKPFVTLIDGRFSPWSASRS